MLVCRRMMIEEGASKANERGRLDGMAIDFA
jgi:hypothetical protein